MKILIPTDDSLTIASGFENAKSYMVMKILNGKIIEESCISVTDELRSRFPIDIDDLRDEHDSDNINGSDKLKQQIALTAAISDRDADNLKKLHYNVFHTDEKFIINAITSFLKSQTIKESDYCCCP